MPKLVRVPERNVEHAHGVYLLSYEHRLIKRYAVIISPLFMDVKSNRLFNDGLLVSPPVTKKSVRLWRSAAAGVRFPSFALASMVPKS